MPGRVLLLLRRYHLHLRLSLQYLSPLVEQDELNSEWESEWTEDCYGASRTMICKYLLYRIQWLALLAECCVGMYDNGIDCSDESF